MTIPTAPMGGIPDASPVDPRGGGRRAAAPQGALYGLLNEPGHSTDAGFRRASHCV